MEKLKLSLNGGNISIDISIQTNQQHPIDEAFEELTRFKDLFSGQIIYNHEQRVNIRSKLSSFRELMPDHVKLLVAGEIEMLDKEKIPCVVNAEVLQTLNEVMKTKPF